MNARNKNKNLEILKFLENFFACVESARYIKPRGYKVNYISLRAWSYTIQAPRCLEEEGKPRRGSRVMQIYSSYSLIIQQNRWLFD